MTAELVPGEGTTYLPIDSIRVGERVRTDLGNIAELADSIAAVGLLHPVVITDQRALVAGERRLAAARSLGWAQVPVRVVDLATAADALRAERDENTCRKEFLPSEAERIDAAIVAALAPVREALRREKIAEAAEARPRDDAGRLAPQPDGGNLPPSGPPAPKARDVAAAATGRSASTIRKVREARTVAEDAKAPEPVRQVAREALAEMDRTGKVDAAHKKVKAAQAQAFVSSLTDAIDRRNPDAKSGRERAALKATYSRGMKGVADLLLLDTEATASVLSDTETRLMAAVVKKLSAWAEQVTSARRRTGLSLIEGGAQ